MLERDAILKTIRDIYDARLAGDTKTMALHFAENAHFEIAVDHSLHSALPRNGVQAREALGALIERFEFSDLKLLDAVVEGHKVAARWRVTVKAKGKDPVITELCDLIHLDGQGKIKSFVQFVDSALVLKIS